jgi:hypothetical protein
MIMFMMEDETDSRFRGLTDSKSFSLAIRALCIRKGNAERELLSNCGEYQNFSRYYVVHPIYCTGIILSIIFSVKLAPSSTNSLHRQKNLMAREKTQSIKGRWRPREQASRGYVNW